MELQKIKQLIDLLAASDLGELELIEGDHKIRLVKRVRPVESMSAVAEFLPGVQSATPRAACERAPPANPTESVSVPAKNNREVVTAPLFGVLHLTPAPDAPAFVGPGDMVQPGQTLCVVEAMKMFHEVKAELAARVDAILVRTGQEVAAGEPLFRMAAME